MMMARAGLVCLAGAPLTSALSWSAGFSDDAVFQRSKDQGTAIYGFAHSDAAAIEVAVAGTSGSGGAVSYKVVAVASPWVDTTGCNATACLDRKTPVPPPHGAFVWRALLQPQPVGGGQFTVTVSSVSHAEPNATLVLERVTYGDVYFCSGQSNMALETYYTYSVDTLKAEIAAGKYSGLRHYMFGSMSNHFLSLSPQWVTSWNSLSAGPQYTWHNVTASAALPSRIPSQSHASHVSHSAFTQFSATCMYFGVELIDAREAAGLEAVPIGLIQSAIGGSQIEAWMSNETLHECTDQSLSGGAASLPDGSDSGQLYYGMTAPFANFSVAGWLWYQGENNCHGVMGNSQLHSGYGCSLVAMINAWRHVWRASSSALFGIATLAAGGSEGAGQHMAGMRWSQTANWGSWPNPSMPNVFGAQVYDLGDPWAVLGDGNQRMTNKTTGEVLQPETVACCFPPTPSYNLTGTPGCPNRTSPEHAMQKACVDLYNCSLPNPTTGKYGRQCATWPDDQAWPSKLRPLAKLIRANNPSGIPGVNFMGGIHPRLKRPVGRRLAYAAVMQLKHQALQSGSKDATATPLAAAATAAARLSITGAVTGPTIAGCAHSAGENQLTLKFNSSLLGGESLQLRPFDANETGGWVSTGQPGSADTLDASGVMVCTVDPDPESPMAGQCNASTCECQSWNYVKQNISQNGEYRLKGFWYCEVGPGWKPPPEAVAAERRSRILAQQHWKERGGDLDMVAAGQGQGAHSRNRERDEPMLGWVPPVAPCINQWKPAPLKPLAVTDTLMAGSTDARSSASSDGSTRVVSSMMLAVDLTHTEMKGRTPLAIRLGWPLGMHHGLSYTCCPTAALHARVGNGACLPGNCPLYSSESELPANPFFAVVVDGKCRCPSPQTCDE
jgi:hypothetical protein